MTAESIEIRRCEDLEELRACVSLQKEVWDFSDADLVPLRMFVVAGKIGGQVIGGFDGNRLVAFLIAVPGVRQGIPYLHSHMLAVRQEYRNAGLGTQMKLFQRQDALHRGIDLIEWTFDPLEIKNAHFNIETLGVIACRYSENQYGVTSSPLHGGLPSDRLTAEWQLRSHRVINLLSSGVRESFKVERSIAIPVEIYEWKADPALRERSLEFQAGVRKSFIEAFAQNFAVLGYDLDPSGNGNFLLGSCKENM